MGTALLLAASCAALMGYAIQRGATCTVAAVDELLNQRSGQRLLGMAEAALWVAGGLAIARALGVLPQMPAAYAPGGLTLLGGMLLGFGAWVAGACVFGAIARVGNGDWAYAVTPLGYYLGCASVGPVFMPMAPRALADASPVLRAAGPWALLFLAFAAWRVLRPLRAVMRDADLPTSRARWQALMLRLWAPRPATAVIGVAFAAMLPLVGAWAYTDVLADLARGMAMNLATRWLLFVMLFSGALFGGWRAGRFRAAMPVPQRLARCFAGGVLMAWGSLLIPGSNDGLILVGMPLLRPYAWLAFLTMCLTIAVAIGAQRAFAARWQPTGAR